MALDQNLNLTMQNSVEQQFQLQTAISRKRNDEFQIRWCQNSSIFEGFHLLFHESGVAPRFHPLSALFRPFSGCSRCGPLRLFGPEHAPGTTFHVGKKKKVINYDNKIVMGLIQAYVLMNKYQGLPYFLVKKVHFYPKIT